MLGCQMGGSNTLLLREKLGVVGSLLIVCFPTGSGVYRKIVSQPLLPTCVWVFLIHLLCRSHSASFWIYFRGNCFVCNWRFDVSFGSGAFRSHLCCHLELKNCQDLFFGWFPRRKKVMEKMLIIQTKFKCASNLWQFHCKQHKKWRNILPVFKNYYYVI